MMVSSMLWKLHSSVACLVSYLPEILASKMSSTETMSTKKERRFHLSTLLRSAQRIETYLKAITVQAAEKVNAFDSRNSSYTFGFLTEKFR